MHLDPSRYNQVNPLKRYPTNYQFFVIDCPYCHAPLSGISDECNLFRKSETKKLTNVISSYQKSFLQCRLHLITLNFDQKADLPPIIFWIFNRAGLSEGTSKQGKNRDIAILIEPNLTRPTENILLA